ncbi:MAG: bifunctional [glutamate--ammonia ligase]-adenylyl-L-tyrosine phosphorylase/[glutamate--ammonia-ligase] adenylyltransferase, partial [Gammaproteobacteria bacterium]|nr:bifunctional [glutamate--ammonia ligase]-adenylyl-L-tyrosine phosphorylase/[glutamate--ammonia-ligase] adenylyltransferase [Gammaproteobacteria bacterium]
ACACKTISIRCLPRRNSPRKRGRSPRSASGAGTWSKEKRALDIDLILCYPEDGATRGARSISNEEYFTRLAQRLIHALDAPTGEGFVFRVDTRLRPFGESGPLAASFEALEDYYQTHGREWERYAFIKARVIAGDRVAGARLLKNLQPFVYRRYLDFGAFESLREMKRLIAQEVARKNLGGNIKLGPGGIREVEFICQALQLVRGGRTAELRSPSTLLILERLRALDILPDYAVTELRAAYVFLRRAENHLQEIADAQTHALPQDELTRARLAYSMGYTDWAAFSAALDEQRVRVQNHFDQVFAAPQLTTEEGAQPAQRLWSGDMEQGEARACLREQGYADPVEALRRITLLREGFTYRALSDAGRKRVDRLMPLLINALAALPSDSERDAALPRALNVIEGVARRSTYIALLGEHPLALSQLVRLCAVSPWIAAELARHPVLLDELLDARTLYEPVGLAQIREELHAALGGIEEADIEQRMDRLRQFKQAQVLHTAAADIAGKLDPAAVSEQLSILAEASLAAALDMAWSETVKKYAPPQGEDFAIIGYGKLGARELNYASDLDLIFLYDAAEQNGADSGAFFARLAQRVIRILNAHTAAGVLYEVDVRLRPDGASGLLVSSIAAFSDYQRSRAWTWEHQALVRARVVAQRGGGVLMQRFDALRAEILGRMRDVDELSREVRAMRERMRRELGSREAGLFDLKQDAGGIADIEFIVQYGVLAWAHAHADLAQARSVTDLLERFAHHRLMAAPDASRLGEIYDHYRREINRSALQQRPVRVPAAPFAAERAEVVRLWREWLEPG